MTPDQIDNILMFAGYVTTVVLVITMIYRGLHLQFPIFIYLPGFRTHHRSADVLAVLSCKRDLQHSLFYLQRGGLHIASLRVARNRIERASPRKKVAAARSLLVFGLLVLFAAVATALLAFKVLPQAALSHLPDFPAKDWPGTGTHAYGDLCSDRGVRTDARHRMEESRSPAGDRLGLLFRGKPHHRNNP